MSEDEVKQKVFDDMINFGIGAFKTELNDGKPHIKYIDPSDPTLAELEAIERGELTIEKLTMEQLKERYDLTLPNYEKEVELVSNDKSKRIFFSQKHLGYIPINKSLTPTSKVQDKILKGIIYLTASLAVIFIIYVIFW